MMDEYIGSFSGSLIPSYIVWQDSIHQFYMAYAAGIKQDSALLFSVDGCKGCSKPGCMWDHMCGLR